ncbi:Autophagy protein 22 [Entomophthora muscae]|uniref:Autophagy protein 22 n=1 Tax=Entomophthora muscae TaxID=34485 RepID=A0ACC2S0G8_9FUNG|nr:Autophagy protein 22 [Entomophthora muscae]
MRFWIDEFLKEIRWNLKNELGFSLGRSIWEWVRGANQKENLATRSWSLLIPEMEFSFINTRAGYQALDMTRINPVEPTPGGPVSKHEKWGFYMFGFATEPFYATAMAVCIPIILETLSAEAGYEYDLVTPCNVTGTYQCKVNFGGWWFDTSSFTLYVTAVSVAVQALVFISLSSIADYGNLRKPMLLGSASISALFSILFLTIVKSEHYWLAALYTIIANVSFGASYVFYYAYVPTLTQFSAEVMSALPSAASSVREQVANEISGNGFAFGYLGAVINLAFSVGLIFLTKDVVPVSTYPLQLACAFTGVWMFVFMSATAKWLENRPGAKLPAGESYLLFSWKQIIFTLRNARHLSQAFMFLLSWFIMSDAVSTIVSIAIIFAKKNLGLTLSDLMMAALIVPLSAGAGCIFWARLRSLFKLSTKTMILIVTALYVTLPIYGLIGLTDVGFGLVTKIEVFIFAVLHGFLLGAIQSFYRVLYSEMLPPGKENEFFGLYEITDKGSSWIGPLVVGAITELTGNIRHGFFFLVISMIIPFFITLNVDPALGIKQARAYEDKIKEQFSLHVGLEDM